MDIISTDVGSLPPRVDVKTLDDNIIFEQEVVYAFIDKLECIDKPMYPQFKDMIKTFVDLMDNTHPIIPEVDIIKRNLSKIKDAVGYGTVPIGVQLTGPYTLSAESKYRASMIPFYTEFLCKVLKSTLFKNTYGETTQVCIDEPAFGFLNDPFLDYGSPTRNILRKSWDSICKVASSKGIETIIHLHNTSDNLFWEVEHLDIIESHVLDSIYYLNSTKELLEKYDKFLRASIAITDFDKMIMMKVGENPELLANCWNEIKAEKVNPNIFLEDKTTMKKRLSNIIERFGSERIPYFGAECGLKGFPSYDCAIDYLWEIHNINILS